MSAEFIMPGKIISGAGALASAGGLLKTFGKRALVVTDGAMIKLGNLDRLTAVLDKNNIPFEVFSGITGEPTDTMVAEGYSAYKAGNCDFLIALGGGSPMDTMKAVAASTLSDCHLREYMGKEIAGAFPKMAAIPTTAGTGSEATKFTIITDTERGVKMLLKGDALMPDLAIIDPHFTISSPPSLTAATGLDALCHAVEAYTSRKAQPLTDSFALSAVRRIFKNLPKAFHDGSDVAARAEMSLAALEAGAAFNNASVTIIHGMSRPIGALFHVPHGISNAMLMSECLAFALPGAYSRFAELARTIGVSGDNGIEADANRFLDAVNGLIRELEIPTLEKYGVDRGAFFDNMDKMAGDAMISGSPQNTIREVTKADVLAIYERLWR